MNANRSFGTWLRQRRKALDLTQPDLAEQVACSVTTLQKIEADERRPSKQITERLADVLAISLEERAAFVAFARRSGTSVPVPVLHSVVSTPSHNLPSQPTPFIGREDELAQITEQLANPACRLLTLVGPGGIGKTRLAIEAARCFTNSFAMGEGASPSFVDGVYFIELQPVDDSAILIPAIANALGALLSGSEDPRDQLLDYLSARDTLLLLDNFEQLLDSVNLLADILNNAPGVKLLVTSREALNIQEEWLWQVVGLQTPDYQPGTNIESYVAVQLFAERARRSRRDFTLTSQEASVARICQLVDGMPLALELAAGWTKALSCAGIAQEIQQSLDFLTTNIRNVHERHRSIQAVFDHSWRLLTASEREAFPRLAVFRGGFRREAAEQVAGATLTVLAGLVDKSFLRLNASGRYEIHELMRQYGEEHLAATPDAKTEMQDRHCAYYAGFLHQRQGALRSSNQAAPLDEIGDELDNVRVSWQWAVERGMEQQVYQSMHSLYLFCHIRAQAFEGQRLFEIAVERFTHDDSQILAYLLLARISLGWFNGKAIGADQFPRAIQLAYTFWYEDEIAVLLGTTYWSIRDELIAKKLFDDQRLEQLFQDFLERYRANGQPWGATFMLFHLGDLFFRTGKTEQAESCYRTCLESFLQIGDRWGCNWASQRIAFVLEKFDKYHESLQWWQQHQHGCAEIGDQGGVVFALAQKARVAEKLQDHKTARLYVTQGIKAHLQSGSQFAQQVMLLRSLIEVFLNENKDERAIELLGFMRLRTDKAHPSDDVVEAEQKMAPLARQLLPDLYQQALERGKTLHFKTILEQLQDELAGYSPSSTQIPVPVPLQETAPDQSAVPSSPAQTGLDALTERELEVLRLLATGRSNREIAQALVLALGTVKWYISEIYGKLDVTSRTQAIARAGELNLLA